MDIPGTGKRALEHPASLQINQVEVGAPVLARRISNPSADSSNEGVKKKHRERLVVYIRLSLRR